VSKRGEPHPQLYHGFSSSSLSLSTSLPSSFFLPSSPAYLIPSFQPPRRIFSRNVSGQLRVILPISFIRRDHHGLALLLHHAFHGRVHKGREPDVAQLESDIIPHVKVRRHGGAVLQGDGKVDSQHIAGAGDGGAQRHSGGRKGAARGGGGRGGGSGGKECEGRGREEQEKGHGPGQEEEGVGRGWRHTVVCVVERGEGG